MTTVINGSSPSITFSDSTTQSTAALPLTGGTVTGQTVFSADILVNSASGYTQYLRNLSGINRLDSYNYPITNTVPWAINASLIYFNIADTEKMRLDASGRLLLGCTSTPSSTVGGVLVGNQSSAEGFISSTGTYTGGSDRCLFINGNGTVGKISVSGSTTTYATSSDYRLKENVSPMANALDRVSALKPVTYTWKADGSHGEGFIAHELQEVCPDAVIGEKDAVNEDGTIKAQSIDTSFLIATLTAAIQELKAELDATKAEVQALKAK